MEESESVNTKPSKLMHLDALFGRQMQKHIRGQQPAQLMKAKNKQHIPAKENIKLN